MEPGFRRGPSKKPLTDDERRRVLAELRQTEARDAVRAHRVDGEQFLDLGGVGVGDGPAAAGDTGVVDQDVDAPESVEYFIGHPLAFLGPSQIGGNGHRLAVLGSDVVGDGRDPRVSIDQDDGGAFGRQAVGYGRTHTAGSPGHDGDSIRETDRDRVFDSHLEHLRL